MKLRRISLLSMVLQSGNSKAGEIDKKILVLGIITLQKIKCLRMARFNYFPL